MIRVFIPHQHPLYMSYLGIENLLIHLGMLDIEISEYPKNKIINGFKEILESSKACKFSVLQPH